MNKWKSCVYGGAHPANCVSSQHKQAAFCRRPRGLLCLCGSDSLPGIDGQGGTGRLRDYDHHAVFQESTPLLTRDSRCLLKWLDGNWTLDESTKRKIMNQAPCDNTCSWDNWKSGRDVA